ncbi:HhH-GPD family base excision DNA repair protein [Lasiosphaeria ovina]|uniref:HhH-GPD family base excision DNA repair protein n=1 Tax=Lasiosphaeria ovina TaxID=92902 RepID=A0AAE0NM59_9PEZI|nr:HhH-GPD family base excision DNA repair protein [Lasiosphaeria ovina]
MAKRIATTAAVAQRTQPARAARHTTKSAPKVEPATKVKPEPDLPDTLSRVAKVKKEDSPNLKSTLSTPTKPKAIKKEDDAVPSSPPSSPTSISPPSPTKRTAATKNLPADLQARKLKAYTQHGSHTSPFPDFPHPTPSDCQRALTILTSLHGARTRPAQLKASATRAGCGDAPCVLDALVRTILSQNTTDTNSSRAYRSLNRVYGTTDDSDSKWAAIAAGGPAKLERAIRCGGLSAVKSRTIVSLLAQVSAHAGGSYSLEHLRTMSADAAMRSLLAFRGVGPKTASCVALFSLGHASFAVDTHVWRLAGLLGWRPRSASRDATHLHLDAAVPDECKYALHVLLVTHGKRCGECRAGGKAAGACPLRRAFPAEVTSGL